MACRRTTLPARHRQAGQAFMLSLLVIGIAGVSLVYNLANPARASLDADARTYAALAAAREALIGYAAGQQTGATTAAFRPGELPCPDQNNDGNEEATCDTAALRVGRLPWRTLGLPDPRDSAGERLWYAVSDAYKNSTQLSATPLNSDTPGDYTVTGITTANSVIAIVFAPGAALGTQVRDAANANIASNYLDGANADGDTTFATALSSSTFNDKLLLITHDALFPAVINRVAREIRTTLSAYYATNTYFPYPASNPATYRCDASAQEGWIPASGSMSADCGLVDWTPPVWFYPNNWHTVTFYAVSPFCTQSGTGGFFGTLLCNAFYGLTVYNSNWTTFSSARALVIVTGRALTGQTRPCAAVADCVDNTENSDSDNTFYAGPISSSNNDRLVVISP